MLRRFRVLLLQFIESAGRTILTPFDCGRRNGVADRLQFQVIRPHLSLALHADAEADAQRIGRNIRDELHLIPSRVLRLELDDVVQDVISVLHIDAQPQSAALFGFIRVDPTGQAHALPAVRVSADALPDGIPGHTRASRPQIEAGTPRMLDAVIDARLVVGCERAFPPGCNQERSEESREHQPSEYQRLPGCWAPNSDGEVNG